MKYVNSMKKFKIPLKFIKIKKSFLKFIDSDIIKNYLLFIFKRA